MLVRRQLFGRTHFDADQMLLRLSIFGGTCWSRAYQKVNEVLAAWKRLLWRLLWFLTRASRSLLTFELLLLHLLPLEELDALDHREARCKTILWILLLFLVRLFGYLGSK